MIKKYSSLDKLPKEYQPYFLHQREDAVIPSLPINHTEHSMFQEFESDTAIQWEKGEKSKSLFIAHALSFSSQRRVLDAYYTNAQDLSTEQLILYSPFILLAVRQLISGSLIDMEYPASLITRNGFGFLFKVPPKCIYTISPIDANVPLEKRGVTQKQFREQLYTDKIQRSTGLNQNPISITPKKLLSMTLDNKKNESYNEIAFFPRILNPHKTIHLVGVFIDTDNLNFGSQNPERDIEIASVCFQLMKKISRDLNLPFFNLRDMREKASVNYKPRSIAIHL